MTKPGDSQTKKTIHELAKEFPEKTYKELDKYRDADRQEEAIGIGHNHPTTKNYPDLTEVMAGENEKLKKRAQEAEGELSILKGIETNRVKEAQARCNQLQDELDRIKRENNDCYNKIADLTEVAQSKDYFRDPDYKYLIEENRKLEQERNELLVVNKNLNREAEEKLAQARKAGM